MFSENDSKKQYEKTDRKSIMTSKNVLSWLLATLLVILIAVVSVQFFYPMVTYEKIFLQDSVIHTTETEQKDKEGIEQTDKKANEQNDKKEIKFSLNPKDLCSKFDEVELLVLIASCADHVDRRTTIRKTWGSVANSHQDPTVRLAFVVDSTNVSQVSENLAEESIFFGDIIQVADSTPKSVAMLNWVADHCADVRYFLKTDDDTFVNVDVVSKLLSRDPFASHPKFIGGFVVHTDEQQDGWQEMPEEDTDAIKKYITGSAYITRGPTAVELYEATLGQMHPISPFEEDMFVTGQCGQNIGVVHVHEPLFAPLPMTPFSPQTCGSLASAPGLAPVEMQMLWNAIQDGIMGAISDVLMEDLIDDNDDDDLISMPLSSSSVTFMV